VTFRDRSKDLAKQEGVIDEYLKTNSEKRQSIPYVLIKGRRLVLKRLCALNQQTLAVLTRSADVWRFILGKDEQDSTAEKDERTIDFKKLKTSCTALSWGSQGCGMCMSCLGNSRGCSKHV
jgi:hypothetical protein